MRKIGDLLREFLKERGWPLSDPYTPLFECWPQIVGKEFADHSIAESVDDGVLIVSVDHPGYYQMFLIKKREFLENARRAAPDGTLRDIRVRLSRKGSAGAGPKPIETRR